MAKVTFDGTNKLIIVSSSVTSLNVKTDLYSDWKEWMTTDDNAKYEIAFSSVGGDPIISGSYYLGSTFFLENDWKIRPQEANHTLTVDGNLYTRDQSSPFVQTIGSYNVLISMVRSNLVDQVIVGGSTGGASAADVWAFPTTNLTSSLSVGELIDKTNKTVNDNQALIIAV